MICLKQNEEIEGIKLLKEAFELKNYEAPASLGAYYERKKEYNKAYYYYSIGAENSNGKACFGMGILYEKGKGVTKNLNKAREYYTLALNCGYERARQFLVSLGNYTLSDIEVLEKQALEGDILAKGILARYNYEKANYQKAKIYALEASVMGYNDSFLVLGLIESKVNKNYINAIKYFEKGKERGISYCLSEEANCYLKLKNNEKAEELFLEYIDKYSGNDFIYKKLVQIYSNLNKSEFVEKYYNLIKNKDNSVKKSYAFFKYKSKAYLEASEIYETLELKSGDYSNLTKCYIEMEELEKAKSIIEKIKNDENLKEKIPELLKKIEALEKKKENENISEDEKILNDIKDNIQHNSTIVESLKYELLIKEEKKDNIEIKDITFCALGGGNEIGASSYFINIDNLNFLIDCGLRVKRNIYNESFPKFNFLYEKKLLKNNNLNGIILTHGHLDHVGSLIAAREEFKNTPIYSSAVTKDLIYFLLNEINFTEKSEFFDNNLNLRKYEQLLLEKTIFSIYEKKIGEVIPIDDCKIQLFEAGHILGARMCLIEKDGYKILITGDFSDFDQESISKYRIPENLKVDILITEGTHYNINKETDREDETKKLILEIKKNLIYSKGNILIPAFSIGRAQEIALILKKAILQNKLPKVPVYVDGTAKIVSNIYEKHGISIFDDIIKEAPNNLIYSFDNEKSIIISSSGMLLENCKASRYIEKIISKTENAVIFTGFLSPDSKGYKLLKAYETGQEKFLINGKKIPLNSYVSSVNLGAHTTQQGIINLIEKVSPNKVVLVHNNPIFSQNNLFNTLKNKFEKIEILQSYNKLVMHL